MRQYEPSCKISYLTLISEFLTDFRELHSQLDIFDRFGKDCLTDITDVSRAETIAMARSWPIGAERKAYQFKESEKRWGILDVIFYEGRLINFRAQIFFQGFFIKSKAFKLSTLRLCSLIDEIYGVGNVNHDSFNDTCSCSDGHGLKMTLHCIPKSTSIETIIAEEAYA